MHLNRKGKEIVIALDSEEEAIGLHAFLSGTVHTVSPEIASKGQFIYNWFFSAIQKLAQSYKTEKTTATQSAETTQLARETLSSKRPLRRRKR